MIRRDQQAEQLRRVHADHRFTTAMQTDVIHVMDSGRVVESSTHAESVAVVRLLRRVVATADAGGGRHGHVSFALAPGEFVAILGPQWLR